MTSSAFDLQGKVAVVTGGNGGIGLGFARGFAKSGANIAIWSRNLEKSARAVAELESLGIRAVAFKVDVNIRADIDQAVIDTVAELGSIDILVANAGINIRKNPQDFSKADWKNVLDTNLTAVFECCQAVYPEMKKRGGGKIITIGSMTSIFGFGITSAYAATKGAVVQLAKSLAVAWGADNIQVNAVLPGWVKTEMTTQSRSIPGLEQQVMQRTPANRWGTESDFEGVAAFLGSAASDFVTGIAIPIDGGFSGTLFIFDPPE